MPSTREWHLFAYFVSSIFRALLQKLTERKAVLARRSFNDSGRDLEQWKAILTLDTMSSDESCDDDGEEVLIVHPVPCLSHTIEQFKLSLDQQIARATDEETKNWLSFCA